MQLFATGGAALTCQALKAAEVDLFLQWLDKTNPGANVDLFTVYGWVSAELFVQALKDAGPQATRE